MSGRIAYFDNSKAILIILVVFSHLLTPFIDDSRLLYAIYHFMFIFHMPAFIFIAGYFTRNVHKKDYYKKILTMFVIPYLILQVIYALYYNMLYTKSFSIEFLTPRWAMWFLICIAAYKAVAPLLIKWNPYVVTGASLLPGLLIGFFEVDRFLSLDRLFVFMPFFMLGMYMGNRGLPFKLEGKHVKIASVLVLSIAFTGMMVFDIDNISKILYGTNVYASSFGLVIRMIYYVAASIVTFAFFNVITTRPIKLTFVGAHTFAIYLLHGFLIKWFLEQDFSRIVEASEGLFAILLAIVISVIFSAPIFSVLVGSRPLRIGNSQ
ncbi:acyltransferase family protein [Pseudalkalibacillus caeni]|nr:acyltransferase family protein [Pseudalkalibacillus caeni]